MADLLGPANALFVTTSRPTDSRIYPGVDTWFKDCTNPSSEDGTLVSAGYMNGILAQVRRAIRGMGVTENNSDDDMLLKAIQRAVLGYVTEAQLFTSMPIHAQVNNSGFIAVTPSTGQLIVNTGQYIGRRGTKQYFSSDIDLANRTFVTTGSKTYHLRWNAPGFARATPAGSWPNGRYYLEDLADAGTYNPSVLAETNTTFDSTPDNVLLAKVVTDAGNALTVTPLFNIPFMFTDMTSWLDQSTPGAFVGPTVDGGFGCNHTFTYNWGRTPPFVIPVGIMTINSAESAWYMSGRINDIIPAIHTRYGFATIVQGDWLAPLPTIYTYESRLNIKVIA